MLHIDRYSPSGMFRSSLCVPRSTMCPCFRTMMLSQPAMVPRRCAIVTDVRESESFTNAAWMSASVRESRADVASSRMTIGGFFAKSRAMATRCFSPPLNFKPRSPTTVSQPSSRRAMKSESAACFAAESRVFSSQPRAP
mmetsp:Transcript_17277/g.53117  ORF Transcript_17277/g.53117 Transcript_17277/m.53117 type:complete len:140 (-) Transcript_17277:2201-2620(-)